MTVGKDSCERTRQYFEGWIHFLKNKCFGLEQDSKEHQNRITQIESDAKHLLTTDKAEAVRHHATLTIILSIVNLALLVLHCIIIVWIK